MNNFLIKNLIIFRVENWNGSCVCMTLDAYIDGPQGVEGTREEKTATQYYNEKF